MLRLNVADARDEMARKVSERGSEVFILPKTEGVLIY